MAKIIVVEFWRLIKIRKSKYLTKMFIIDKIKFVAPPILSREYNN